MKNYFFLIYYNYINKHSLSIFLENISGPTQKRFLSEFIKRRRITSHIRSLTIISPFARHHEIFQHTILELIKSSKHLQKLSLKLYHCDHYYFELLQTLHKALRICRGLRTLHLSLSIYELTPEKISNITSFLSQISLFAPKVIDFKIDWRFLPSSIRPPLTVNPFLKMSKGFKSLTSLALELSNLFFEESLRNIRHLTLIVYHPEVAFDAERFPYKSFRKLEDIKITVHEGSVPISWVSQMAANLPKLKNVSLTVFYNQYYEKKPLSEKELRKLTAELSFGIKHLTFLSLTLPKITFTNQVVSDLISLVYCENLKSLQTLDTNFPKCYYFSNYAMEKLGESISKNLGNLKTLRLSLTLVPKPPGFITKAWKTMIERDDLSDKGLMQFGKALTQRTSSLEYLTLQIEECSQISDEGVKEFCGKLGLLPNLKRALLSFEKCEKVTAEPRNYYYYYVFC